jgi:SRSO17 transposase
MDTTMLTTAPVLDLTPTDLDGILDELHAYHASFRPLFARREQRDWAATYLHGLLLDIPRKSIEPMVLHLRGADRNAVRTLQQFVSIGAWDDGPILAQLWREIAADLGDADGVLVVDGSDFPKQGKESVGVKRQYCGQLGKTANCQAGVFLAYASTRGAMRCLTGGCICPRTGSVTPTRSGGQIAGFRPMCPAPPSRC